MELPTLSYDKFSIIFLFLLQRLFHLIMPVHCTLAFSNPNLLLMKPTLYGIVLNYIINRWVLCHLTKQEAI